MAAHAAAPAGVPLTDDAAVAELAGLPLALVAGEAGNIKLTHEDDFMTAAQLRPRTGSGFDVHRFGPAGSADSMYAGRHRRAA